MKLHANAKTCPKSRRLLVDRVVGGERSLTEAAEAAGVSERCAAGWVARWRAEGDAGLQDRSSAPKRVPAKTPADRERAVCALRRLRMTGAEIAECLGLALSTVYAVLRRHGLSRLGALEPLEPPNRYARRHPGELVHMDIKKLGRIGQIGKRITGRSATRVRGIGWEYLHVAIDSASRVAYAEVLDDERAVTVTGFVRRAVAWFSARGVRVRALLTDNGPAYRGRLQRATCGELGLRQLFTRPYRPRTNGKAERLIKTLLAEWAYWRPYGTSADRTAALTTYLHWYNERRGHGSLSHQPPGTRCRALLADNRTPT